jgi:hypothetical protein
VLFYLMTVFTLSWGTSRQLHFSANGFLLMQMFGVLFFALGIPISAVAGRPLRPQAGADRRQRRHRPVRAALLAAARWRAAMAR